MEERPEEEEKRYTDSKITIQDESGEDVELYVLEETKFNGMYYLLVTDADEEEDGECYVLKDVSKTEDTEAIYEFVTEDAELDCMFSIFEELMDDSDTELSK